MVRFLPLAATCLACAAAWLAFSGSRPLVAALGLADFDLPVRLCLVFLVLSGFEAAAARIRRRLQPPH